MPAHPVRTTRYPTRDMPVASLFFKNTFVFSGYAVCFSPTDSTYRPALKSCFRQDNHCKSAGRESKVPVWSACPRPMPVYVPFCAEYKYSLRQHTAGSALLPHWAEFLLLLYIAHVCLLNIYFSGKALAITINIRISGKVRYPSFCCNSQRYADITYRFI